MLIPKRIIEPFGVQGWPKPLENPCAEELVFPDEPILVYRIHRHSPNCDCALCRTKNMAKDYQIYMPA